MLEETTVACPGGVRARFGERLVGLDHQLDLDLDLGDHSEIRRARLTHLYVMKVRQLAVAPTLRALRTLRAAWAAAGTKCGRRGQTRA